MQGHQEGKGIHSLVTVFSLVGSHSDLERSARMHVWFWQACRTVYSQDDTLGFGDFCGLRASFGCSSHPFLLTARYIIPPTVSSLTHLSSAYAKLLFLLIKIFYRQILSSLNFIFHKTWQLDFWVPGLRPSKTNTQKIRRSVQKAWVQPYAYANELDDYFSMCVLICVHVCVCVHVCAFVYISVCIWVWPLNQEVTFPLGLSAQGRSFSSLDALALRLMSSCSPVTILKSSLLPSHFSPCKST